MAAKSFSQIVAEGDRLATLQALRDELARGIEAATDGAELSSLALRLTRVLAEIHELGGASPAEENDALAARRDAKLRAAGGA